jgi:imidazolonepropionase
MASILIRNIKSLAGVREAGLRMVKGAEMKTLPAIDDAYLLIDNGLIKSFGASADAPERAGEIIDAADKFVFPCWCDSHTHIVYAGSREQEFVDKIHGLSYEEIAKRGGGILNSALRLAGATEQELFDAAYLRLQEMEKSGTGAVEINIKSNFLGAHAFPTEFKQNHEGYLDLLINRLLPQIADEGLADFIDVFCDRGFFSPNETDRILQAGAKYGLQPKIHANELDYSGGIEVGVKNHALSVDHLEFTGDEQIEVLRNSVTMPTLLPSTAFYLGLHYAPARKIIDAGLPLAIATDFNPGSSPSGNMPFVVALSCIKMKMLPEEAVNAATLNSAYAMGIEQQLGSITKGKKANVFITKPISSLAFLPYSFGSNLVERVIIS